MSIAVLYNYYDDNFKENRLEWCNATMLKLSTGRNMRTNPGNRLKYYRKGEASVVKWAGNVDDEEKHVDSIQELLPENFNTGVIGSWKVLQ